MATPLAGTLGNVSFGSETQQTEITEWNATIESDMFPDGDFGSTQYFSTETRGMYDLKGTARGLVAAGVLPALTFLPDGALPSGAFVLTSDSGNTYSFTGVISNLSVKTPKKGLAEFTVTFESSGAISYASG